VIDFMLTLTIRLLALIAVCMLLEMALDWVVSR
jgi:hypothetical protein